MAAGDVMAATINAALCRFLMMRMIAQIALTTLTAPKIEPTK
jgi:hypothetical protein